MLWIRAGCYLATVDEWMEEQGITETVAVMLDHFPQKYMPLGILFVLNVLIILINNLYIWIADTKRT